ncbi:MAG: signal peptidase II [Candidatus Kuenenia sp.]|nr:signal peptidase II [Candidatus Kuenenia hertensis]
MKRRTTLFAITIVAGVFADIVSKWFVFSHLDRFKKVTLIPGLLNIIRSENEGVIFGMFPGKANVFIIFSLLAIAAILFVYIKLDKNIFGSNVALGLILSGAIGNLWDRIWFQHVRDFIDLHLGQRYHWPTFNVADSLICVGISIMVFTSFSSSRHKKSE